MAHKTEPQPPPHEALAALGVGVVTTDQEGCIREMNTVAERLTGWVGDDARGEPLQRVVMLTEEEAPDDGSPPRASTRQSPNGRREEAVLVRRDGERLPVEYAVQTTTAADGRPELTVVFAEVSERRLMELRLARISSHDPLTGLLNRSAFNTHLEGALAAHREHGTESAVCFLDIDQLKLVNSTCGHEAGDDLVSWVASLLREEVGEQDAVARLSGDEFGVLLADRGSTEAVSVAEQLQHRLGEFVFTWGKNRFSVSASAGVTPAAPEFASAAQWLSAADHACSMAKDDGRGGIRVWELEDRELNERFQDMRWLARIDSQLASGRAQLYAQPIRRLRGEQDGLQMEILLRFVDPRGQMVVPGHFIRAAERFGLTSTIDRWVIRNALRTLAGLSRTALRRLRICFINLSAISVRDPALLDLIRSELSDSGIPPQKLGFEITETTAVQNLSQALWFIQELRSIGCRLSLDDFGTGVASYSYLKTLPVQYLKIDGGFVEGMGSSALDRAMVESINQISHVLGIETVAESVNGAEPFEDVRAMGIDHAQGFWVARPRPMLEVCEATRSPWQSVPST